MRATVVMWLELCLGLHLTPHCSAYMYMQYNEEFSHTQGREKEGERERERERGREVGGRGRARDRERERGGE